MHISITVDGLTMHQARALLDTTSDLQDLMNQPEDSSGPGPVDITAPSAPMPAVAEDIRDAHGIKYDSRIHTGGDESKRINADGLWRQKRGSKTKEGDYITDELESIYQAAVAEAIEAGAYTQPTPTAAAPAPLVEAAAPAPVPPVPAPAAAPAPPVELASAPLVEAAAPAPPVEAPAPAPAAAPPVEAAAPPATYEGLTAFTTELLIDEKISLEQLNSFLVAFGAVDETTGEPSITGFKQSGPPMIQIAIDYVNKMKIA